MSNTIRNIKNERAIVLMLQTGENEYRYSRFINGDAKNSKEVIYVAELLDAEDTEIFRRDPTALFVKFAEAEKAAKAEQERYEAEVLEYNRTIERRNNDPFRVALRGMLVESGMTEEQIGEMFDKAVKNAIQPEEFTEIEEEVLEELEETA